VITPRHGSKENKTQQACGKFIGINHSLYAAVGVACLLCSNGRNTNKEQKHYKV
jgi:hypothetical protein